jgi:hypothetical protein
MKKLLSGLFRGGLYSIILVAAAYIIFCIDAPTRYVVTEQYNFNSKEKSKIAIAVLVPQNMTYQQISNLKIEGGEKVTVRDTARVQIVIVGPMEVKDSTVLLSYDVYLPKGSISWPGITTLGDLSPQQGIESDNPELIAKSKSIASGQTMEDARKIYNFVSTWLRWPSGKKINITSSAMIAYKSKEGGCQDFARLLTTMLRANGIPARSISGLALPQYVNSKKSAIWSHTAGAHAWVEFFADGQWHFADPSWGGSRHFNRCDGFHLSFDEEQSERQIYELSKSLLVDKFATGIPADSTYSIIGAMSAPLKFIAVASNKGVKISPTGMVKINYGYRFPAMIIIIILMVVYEFLIRSILKNKR